MREPIDASAHGSSVVYDWGDGLEEWWINDARGLEHGFTLRARPECCDDGPLTFTLAVRGTLRARLAVGDSSVRFENASGAAVIDYSHLEVRDAEGRALPAQFEPIDADSFQITIDEMGAHYPLTIDPIAQQAYLKASNAGSGDQFGIAVAISGDTAVVGAWLEDSNATGVNGNQADNSLLDSGAAYVFVRTGTVWSQQAYLKASNTNAGDWFGSRVAISGDTIVVGASHESSQANVVNGDQTDNSALNAGAAYVFVRTGSTWSQQAYLKASNAESGDRFGDALSVSGDTVVVGAGGEDSSSLGINGNPSDNSASGSGAAYVFVRTGTAWSQQAYLKASNAESNDFFGSGVSVFGDTIVVGANGESSSARVVNGNQSDNSATRAGAAYVFVRSGSVWSQQAYLKASNTDSDDAFGGSVSISGDTVVIGALHEASHATGVNGDQNNNDVPLAGAAYVFVRSGTTWTQQAYLKASNTQWSSQFQFDGATCFGRSVSVSGDIVVVGAYNEGSHATGINGDESDNSMPGAGAVYAFMRVGTTWSQKYYLKASNTDLNDRFGASVSVSGSTVVIGAEGEDSASVGINSDGTNNLAPDAGAAYMFPLYEDPTYFCFGDGSGTACPCGNPGDSFSGCANSVSANGARLIGAGHASISSDSFRLTGLNMPNSSALYFQATTQSNGGHGVTFGDGLRCAAGVVTRLGAKANTAGSSQYPVGTDAKISVKGQNAPGNVRTYQIWYRNAAAFCTSQTFNLSNGAQITWDP